ncbi:Candidate phosphomevalonate decarboxylase; COG1355, Predicted dioxygenase [hydrothermal vent metagenome]|uniref:Candidate phosphomevalonate decarboxylase COG1355, Predicted dioxygenase n=1 Tax=hydrothermal vent metagenome TaxID=652676 RepID=A0A3B1BZ12_9ZZZZ
MIRKATVAGAFYPDTKEAINAQIDSFDTRAGEPEPVMGLVVPHAGYTYSGEVAAKVYAGAKVASSVVMIGPNHRGGAGAPSLAIMSEGAWETPAGTVLVNDALASHIMAETPLLEDAPQEHELEHSLEVQVPFLLRLQDKVKIVPIIISHIPDDFIETVADGIYMGIKKFGDGVTLLASTDFSHYVSQNVAERLDGEAIDRILNLDSRGLLDIVREKRISMCGVAPVALVIEVCKAMGAVKAELVDYKTSGDITGDYSSVVGYGGFLIS